MVIVEEVLASGVPVLLLDPEALLLHDLIEEDGIGHRDHPVPLL